MLVPLTMLATTASVRLAQSRIFNKISFFAFLAIFSSITFTAMLDTAVLSIKPFSRWIIFASCAFTQNILDAVRKKMSKRDANLVFK